MKKDFAVIGLGTFGYQLCKKLMDAGANVIAIDIDEEHVNRVAEFAPLVYCCDCTKEDVLKKLDLQDVDHVILAIGKNLEASVLITVLLKELGVKKITARAEEESSKKILLRLGVDEVIDSQELAIANLCGMLLNRRVTQFFQVTEDYGVASLSYTGKSPSKQLKDMNLREKYNLNVLLIRRGNKDFTPSGDDSFMPDDTVVVFGKNAAIKKMEKQIK